MSYLVFSLIQSTVLLGVESSLLLLSWSGSILFAHGSSSLLVWVSGSEESGRSEDSSWATWRDIQENLMVWYWHLISPVLVLCENTTCRDPRELKSRWVPLSITIGRYMSSRGGGLESSAIGLENSGGNCLCAMVNSWDHMPHSGLGASRPLGVGRMVGPSSQGSRTDSSRWMASSGSGVSSTLWVPYP